MNAAEEQNVISMHEARPNHPLPAGVPDVGNLNNLDKVRDILFGSQVRETDRRFARLEERMLKEIGDAREETRRRLDSLENFLKQELGSLGDRLRAENQGREQALEETTRELRDTAKNIHQRIHQLDEQSAQAQRELRQQLLDQSRSLSDELRHKYDELAASIAREAGELRNDKTDRATLASLFTEVAMRLNNEFRLPGED